MTSSGSTPKQNVPITNIVWDFDGVIGDTRTLSWTIAEEIIEILGEHVTIEKQEVFRDYFIRGQNVTPEETRILRGMHRLVMRTRASKIHLFDCVAVLPNLVVPSEIVTSGLAAVASIALGDLKSHFTRVRGSEAGSKSNLLADFGSETLFITDTIVDVQRAAERGIATLAVTWGYDTKVELERVRPNWVVDTKIELTGLLSDLQLVRS